MCGRFAVAGSEDIGEEFGAAGPLPAAPSRYNVAPSQLVAVVGLKPDGMTRGLALLKWGLVPGWSADGNPKVKPINARAETLLDRPTFREPFLHRRCVIPVTGFYEWRKPDRQPFFIRPRAAGMLALAGLWDVWRGGGKPLVTCCIVTTAANELIRPLHDRMPVVVPADRLDPWLNWDTPVETLRTFLTPHPSDALEVVPVSPLVNTPRVDGPELLAPVESPG